MCSESSAVLHLLNPTIYGFQHEHKGFLSKAVQREQAFAFNAVVNLVFRSSSSFRLPTTTDSQMYRLILTIRRASFEGNSFTAS